MVGGDGSLITRPGHHPGSRLYFRPAPSISDLEIPRAEDVDSVDAITGARDFLLDELLGDFGFADDASRAHAVGLLLLPFVRDFIGDHPTPMHGNLAPEPGTGKGYLAQAALIPGCGLVPVTPGAAGDDAEWRKMITSSLLAGVPAIILDNLHGTLNSAALASALTTGRWRDRVLGASRMADLKVRNAWVATANNPSMSDEQARRIVPIFLDPGEVRPSDRDRTAFKHPDLHSWANSNRTELVTSALTLVQHWLMGRAETVAGGHELVRHSEIYGSEAAPSPGSKTLGSFERWAAVIGGILEAADVPGFLENRGRLDAEANEERLEATEFLRAWRMLDLGPVEFRDVLDECQFNGRLRDNLPTGLASVRSEQLHGKLKAWLRDHQDARFGGYRLVLTDGRPRLWEVLGTRT